MATFNPRRFTKPEVLRTLSRAHLIGFLARFESYLWWTTKNERSQRRHPDRQKGKGI